MNRLLDEKNKSVYPYMDILDDFIRNRPLSKKVSKDEVDEVQDNKLKDLELNNDKKSNDRKYSR